MSSSHFKHIDRKEETTRPVSERIKDYKEIYNPLTDEEIIDQSKRCMDCGVPFCHSSCPIGNQIPDFNAAVTNGLWEKAYEILNETNNFPEFTGRICPAPCESACVLSLIKAPITIETIEKNIIEKAFENGLVKPKIPSTRNEKKIAIVGSGPAGLSAAEQLNLIGYDVTVYERDDQIGGLLRYGIPDFKLEKWVIDRRLKLMSEAGIKFKTNCFIGENIKADDIKEQFDAFILCCGALNHRNLNIEGRYLKGVYFAMDYLSDQNKLISGSIDKLEIDAKDKKVIVIGSGDTGADCIGTANRQGATSVIQLAYKDPPPTTRDKSNPWPEVPLVLNISSSHKEGVEQEWSIITKAFIGDQNNELKSIKVVRVQWDDDKSSYEEIKDTEAFIPCDLALIATGFTGTERNSILNQFNIKLDNNNRIQTNGFQIDDTNVFIAGDMKRGQSLVVWAINEGREVAKTVHRYLI